MKKLYLLLALVLVFTLTGCMNRPFKADKEYEYIYTDTVNYVFNDGVTETELFTYTFDQEFHMFIHESDTIYNFKNINNYKELSTELEVFLDSFDIISYSREENSNYREKLELSLGATEKDFNYEKVNIGDVAIDVNAFIVTEEGVNILLSYTEFTIDEEVYLVPSFLQIFTHVIHTEISHEYLGADNDYVEEQAKLINYNHIIVPIPTKTGVESTFYDMQDIDLKEIDDYTRIVEDDTNNTGVHPLCTAEIIEDCIEEKYTQLNVQMYEYTIDEVYDFYYEHYSGSYDGMDFVFVLNGYTFTITNMEQKQVRLSNNEVVDVVNAIIRMHK